MRLLLCAALALAGCYTTPTQELPEDPDVLWEDAPAPPAPPADATLVLAEVTLEFVETRWLYFPSHAMALDPFSVLHVPQLTGWNVRNVDLPDASLTTVLRHLTPALRAVVADAGYTLIPLLDADRCAAEVASHVPPATRSTLPYMDVLGSDTGRVRRLRVVPHPRLAHQPASSEGASGRRRVDGHLRRRFAPWAVLRARLRVGVVDDRAVIERGTRLELWTSEGVWTRTSERALASTERVATSSFTPFDGHRIDVDREAFCRALQDLVPRYLRLGLHAAPRPPNSDDDP